MYIHYYWRVKQELKGDFNTKQMDLVWIGYEYKMMVLGSTLGKILYLYHFFFDVIQNTQAALNYTDFFNIDTEQQY